MGWWQQLRGREGCAHHIIFIVLIVLVLVPVLVLVIMVLIDLIIMLKFQSKSYISCTKSQHMGWRHRQLSGQSGNVAKRIQWGECDWSSDPVQCNWSSCCSAMQLKQQSSSASCIALECMIITFFNTGEGEDKDYCWGICLKSAKRRTTCKVPGILKGEGKRCLNSNAQIWYTSFFFGGASLILFLHLPRPGDHHCHLEFVAPFFTK